MGRPTPWRLVDIPGSHIPLKACSRGILKACTTQMVVRVRHRRAAALPCCQVKQAAGAAAAAACRARPRPCCCCCCSHCPCCKQTGCCTASTESTSAVKAVVCSSGVRRQLCKHTATAGAAVCRCCCKHTVAAAGCCYRLAHHQGSVKLLVCLLSFQQQRCNGQIFGDLCEVVGPTAAAAGSRRPAAVCRCCCCCWRSAQPVSTRSNSCC